MSHEIVTLPHTLIYPSDVPRRESWEQAVKNIPEMNPISLVDLSLTSIALIHLYENVFIPYEGNHRIARMIQLLGNNFEIKAKLFQLDFDDELEWEDNRNYLVNTHTINTFNDFLSRINEGTFYTSLFNHGQ